MLIYQAYLHAQHYMGSYVHLSGIPACTTLYKLCKYTCMHNTIWAAMLIYQAYLHVQHYMGSYVNLPSIPACTTIYGIPAVSNVNLPSIPACTTLYGQLC